MLVILKLYEILDGTKVTWDKRGLGFENGSSTPSSLVLKFFEHTAIDPKLKIVATTKKGKLVFKSLPPSFSKVNTSPYVTSYHHIIGGLLPLPTHFSHVFHHSSERGHLRPHCGKLTSHPHIKLFLTHLSFILLKVLYGIRHPISLTLLHVRAIPGALLAILLSNTLVIFRALLGYPLLARLILSSRGVPTVVPISIAKLGVVCTKGMV